MDIESRVILLAILKKEDDESLHEVLLKLVETGMFELKEGKRLLKKLKAQQYVEDGGLTVIGLSAANDALREFTV